MPDSMHDSIPEKCFPKTSETRIAESRDGSTVAGSVAGSVAGQRCQ